MNRQITELKDSIIRNETSFPEIFNMTEAEVLEITNAASNYLGDSGKATLCSYRDWCLMYKGIHSEGTWESTQRNWLAAIRWFKTQSPSAPKVEVSAEQAAEERYPMTIDGLAGPVEQERAKNDIKKKRLCFIAGWNQHASSLQQENDKLKANFKKASDALIEINNIFWESPESVLKVVQQMYDIATSVLKELNIDNALNKKP